VRRSGRVGLRAKIMISGTASNPTNKLRPTSFLLSVCVHLSVLAFLAFGPRPSPSPARPIYDSVIRPNERKIIWYRKLPEVTPTKRLSDAEQPQGAIKSPRTMLAMSKRPTSSQQLVLQAPEIKLEQDIKAPNLIAVTAPPPEFKAPKRFVAPAAPPKKAAEAPQLSQPQLKTPAGDLGRPGQPLPFAAVKPPARPFVPPPSKSPKLAPGDAVVLEGPDQSVSLVAGNGGAIKGLPGPVGQQKVPAIPFTPPSRSSASGSGSGTGGPGLESAPNLASGSNLSTAIVGLNPTATLTSPIPPGSRSAQFSTAPNVGPPATGEVSGGKGIAIPDLMIRNGKQMSDKLGVSPYDLTARTVLYRDVVSGSLVRTLSAPLRPASRTIPRSLESRFQGRLVYVMVIPAPFLPAYTGDWIVWFAEMEPRPGESHEIRAPIPYQKIEPISSPCLAGGTRAEARVQLAAIIKPDGRFNSITAIRASSPNSMGAIEDLKRWEFRPATRDGSPVEVEAVIEIPFCLASLASTQ
jgi:Gram-negative bacterial TonB protein C-terminal